MDNFILNVTKNYYAKFIYFADNSSFIKEEFEQLFNITKKEQLYEFIDKSTIIQSDQKDTLQNFFENKLYVEEEKNYLLNYFEIKNKMVDRIEILNNILPFNSLNTLVIDKKLLKNQEVTDFYELRKEIKDIERFLSQYSKNKALDNLSVIFINSTSMSGQYNRINDTITLKTDSLNSSTLHHEFFHLLDNHLGKKYNLTNLFSNENIQVKELELFNQMIEKLDNFIEGKTKDTFVCYYQKYLGKDFQKEINSVQDVYHKIRNMKYLDNEIMIHPNKINYIDRLAEEIFSYTEYIKHGLTKPKRNLYAIFSDIVDLDLSSKQSYIARTSEKLARIYQSSFTIDKDSLFPLGHEKEVLTSQLIYVLNKEIKPLLINQNPLTKIMELREAFNSSIKKNIKHTF